MGYKNQSVNAVYGNNCFFPQIHTKYTNKLCGQNIELLNVKLVVHNDNWALKGYISVIKTSKLMLKGEIIAVSSEIHTKHTNTQ
jgi:hypothetical protein